MIYIVVSTIDDEFEYPLKDNLDNYDICNCIVLNLKNFKLWMHVSPQWKQLETHLKIYYVP